MKIIIVCGSDLLCFPTLMRVQESGWLAAVALPAKHAAYLSQALEKTGIKPAHTEVLSKEDYNAELAALIQTVQADVVWVMAFSYRIASDVLTMPPLGVINFHPGKLPGYEGADPVFWQLANGEQNGYISIHRMTEVIDGGPLLVQQALPIIPGENHGIHLQRAGVFIPQLIPELIEKLNDADFKGLDVDRDAETNRFFKKPTSQQLTINWATQSADEIERLVNAANPVYAGAATSIGQMQCRLLEVSPADVNSDGLETPPGTVVYADVLYGIIVSCADYKFLKINIIYTSTGYLSGSKLFQLGVKPGDVFNSSVIN